MQITIEVPDNLPPEELEHRIKEIEAIFKEEAKFIEVVKTNDDHTVKVDPWLEFLDNINEHAVETGITDLAKNHDHYLYGTPKKK